MPPLPPLIMDDMIFWMLQRFHEDMREIIAQWEAVEPLRTEIEAAATEKCMFCGCTVPVEHLEEHIETHASPDMPDMV